MNREILDDRSIVVEGYGSTQGSGRAGHGAQFERLREPEARGVEVGLRLADAAQTIVNSTRSKRGRSCIDRAASSKGRSPRDAKA